MRDEVFRSQAVNTPFLAKSMGSERSIEVRGVRFSVDGVELLDVPDLTLVPQPCSVILGPNGAGKSLLLRVMHGLLRPTQGTVHVHTDEGPLKQAMVFQRPVVLRRSVASNIDYALKTIGLPRSARKARLPELLALAELHDQAGQPARKLSGGEQQKLAIVRALATQPDIVFLDEPTANLDPAATQSIERLLRRIGASGTRLILVTHDIGQARRLGGEIVFLHNGRVIEKTPATTFFDKPRSAQASAFLSGEIVV